MSPPNDQNPSKQTETKWMETTDQLALSRQGETKDTTSANKDNTHKEPTVIINAGINLNCHHPPWAPWGFCTKMCAQPQGLANK